MIVLAACGANNRNAKPKRRRWNEPSSAAASPSPRDSPEADVYSIRDHRQPTEKPRRLRKTAIAPAAYLAPRTDKLMARVRSRVAPAAAKNLLDRLSSAS